MISRRWWSLVVVGALTTAGCGTDPAAAPLTTPSKSTAPVVTIAATSTTDAVTTSTRPPPTAVTTTTAVAVTEGFDPPCVESSSGDSTLQLDEGALDAFGPIASDPALRITLPLSRLAADPESLDPGVSAVRIPGGVLLAVGPSGFGYFDGGILAAVDADGGRRWVRCFDQTIFLPSVAPASSRPTKALVGFSVSQRDAPPLADWRIVSLADGSVVSDLRDLLAAQGLDPAIPLGYFPIAQSPDTIVLGPSSETVIDTTRDQLVRVNLETWKVAVVPFPEQAAVVDLFRLRFQFSDSGELVLMGDGLLAESRSVVTAYHGARWTTADSALRRTFPTRVDFDVASGRLVAFDAFGQEVWRDDNVADPRLEGFRMAASGDVTVVSVCIDQPDLGNCIEDRSLVGIETATGTILWRLAGLRQVSAVGDGFALVSGPPEVTAEGASQFGPWTLIDTSTGQLVDPSQRWPDPEAFRIGCCAEGETVWVHQTGGVLAAVNGRNLAVWYPRSVSLPTTHVSIP